MQNTHSTQPTIEDKTETARDLSYTSLNSEQHINNVVEKIMSYLRGIGEIYATGRYSFSALTGDFLHEEGDAGNEAGFEVRISNHIEDAIYVNFTFHFDEARLDCVYAVPLLYCDADEVEYEIKSVLKQFYKEKSKEEADEPEAHSDLEK